VKKSIWHGWRAPTLASIAANNVNENHRMTVASVCWKLSRNLPFGAMIADNSSTYATNALVFNTRQETEDYALDLSMRWTTVRDYIVCDIDTNPNKVKP